MCLDPGTYDNSQKENIEYELVNAIMAPYAAAEMILLVQVSFHNTKINRSSWQV